MGIARDIYSTANFWYGGYQHTTDMGDNVAWNMAGVGADFIGFMQPVAQQAGRALGATKFVAAAETPIIEAGLLTMMAMSNTCGFGKPDEGQGFGQGSDAFARIDDAMASTDSPESWSGDASSAYSGQNGGQRDRARSVAEADRSIQHVLEREAGQVQHTRDTIDHRTTVLTAAIVPAVAALAIEVPPGLGLVLSTGIQIAAVAGTVPWALQRYQQLHGESTDNAAEIRRHAAAYDEVASKEVSAATCGDGKVSVASPDLQHLAGRQDGLAENMTAAAETTHETNRNVFLSHGLICLQSKNAVSDAVSSRTAAATSMNTISSTLATSLRTAAGQYDATDACQQTNLNGQVPGTAGS